MRSQMDVLCALVIERASPETKEAMQEIVEIVQAVAASRGGGQTALYLDVPDQWLGPERLGPGWLDRPVEETSYPAFLAAKARALLASEPNP